MGRKASKPSSTKIDTRKAQEVWKLPQADWETILGPVDGYQRKGEHHKVRCWGGHADEHPSMTITPHRKKGGIAHCFSCGLTILNPVTLLSKVRKEKLADTAKFLRQKHGLKVLTVAVIEQLESEANRARLKSTVVQLCCDLLKQAVACGIDDEALSKAQLYWAKPALEYLTSRKLGGGALDTSLWPVICDSQLVGILPPLATVQGHFGVDSEEFKFFSGYFDQYLAEGNKHVGSLVLPLHTAPGEVGRVKLRSPVTGSKDIVTVTETDEELPHPGFYGLHYYRTYFTVSGERYAKTVHVVEGEFDALQSIAHMIRNTDDFIVVAAGGGAAPTLDPLERLEIEHVRVVQDNDEGGVRFVRQLAEKTTGDAVSLSVFQWPEGTGVKDPDEAVRALGFSIWSTMMVDDDRFDPLIRWLVERVVEEVDKDRVPIDDKKHISGIAKEWGALLHDRQELRAFAREVAERYGLDSVILDRDLRRGDESEDEFINELKVSLLEHHTPIGIEGCAIKMFHRATRQTYDLPLDDTRGQAQALARFHGPPIDLVRETTGFPAFLVQEGGEESALSFAFMDKQCRDYVNSAISRIACGLPSLEHATRLAQGIHCVDNDVTYVVNERAVWKLGHRGGSLDVTKLDAPVDGERVFYTAGPAWLPGLKRGDFMADVSLASMYARVLELVAAGWRFKHQEVDVPFLTVTIMKMSTESAFKRQSSNLVTGELSSGKSRFVGGLIGGSEFPRINIVAHARSMSGYTAAGIRQGRDGSSLGLVLDEFEDAGTDETKTKRVRGVLEMLRDQISEAPIHHTIGTTTGKERSYRLRFPLVVAAIRPLQDAASMSRFVVFETVKHPGIRDPQEAILSMIDADEIERLRRDLVVGLLRHVPRLRELEMAAREVLAKELPSVPTRTRETYAPVVAMMDLIHEDAARRGEPTRAPDGLSFARQFAATRVEHTARQNSAAISSQILDAVLAIAVETRDYPTTRRSVRQILAETRTKDPMQITPGVYYDPEQHQLVVAWGEVSQQLGDAWRKHSATSLRQLAEREARHVSDETNISDVIQNLSGVMGRGHSSAVVSIYDVREFVLDERQEVERGNGALGGAADQPQVSEDFVA